MSFGFWIPESKSTAAFSVLRLAFGELRCVEMAHLDVVFGYWDLTAG
jgi:hypothetical protein